MFHQSNRGTIVWLLIVGIALVLSLLTGGLSTPVAATLLAAYAVLVFAVARQSTLSSVLTTLSERATRPPEQSEVAREASARARSHRDYDALINLLDIGLIVDEPRPDGLSARRGRFISLDDDGIRPFATVHVPEALAGRMGLVRFELRDDSGKPRFVYEMERWLQAGENALLPDYRMPIRKKAADLPSGGWSAQVSIDGGLLGIHHFNVSDSMAARRRTMGADGEIRQSVWAVEEDESLPLSLEELLRQQSRQQGQS